MSSPHTELRERLLEEMRQYRGKHGIYAADMLETAQLLLEQLDHHPRQAEAAAYCIRQAVVEIFGNTSEYGSLRNVAQSVVDAKYGIQTTNTVNKKESLKLDPAIKNLKNILCDQKPETRLKEIFTERSGIKPDPHSLVKEYRPISRKSSKIMHYVSETRADAREVREHYEKVVDVLAMIFLPSVRLTRIAHLAELSTPQKSNLDELRRIMNNAYGFDHFASKLSSPAWFDLMKPDMLKSPSGDSHWPLRSLAYHLKDAHVSAFIRVLEENFDEWVSDDVGLGELGYVGWQLGDNGLSWLVRTLQASKKFRKECNEKKKVHSEASQPDPELVKEIKRIDNSIRNLDRSAQSAFLDVKEPNHKLVELAKHLLSSDSTIEGYYKTNIIPAKLVECMDQASAIRVVEILIRELRAELGNGWSRILQLGLIDGPSYDRLDGAGSLAASLCGALAKSQDLGVPTSRLIDMLGALPSKDRTKFEAWVYSRADDVKVSEMVRYVINSCNTRSPSAEDGLLLGRLKQDGQIRDISEQVASLLGVAPDTNKMSGHPRQWGISVEEYRRIFWARTMRPYFGLPDEWKPCLDIVDDLYETKRDSGSGQAPGDSGSQDDATWLGVSGIDDPLEVARKIAAKKPDAGGFLGLMDEHSPILYLENTVKNNTSKWAEDPVGIICELRHPEYVARYFRGLAGAEEDLAPYSGVHKFLQTNFPIHGDLIIALGRSYHMV